MPHWEGQEDSSQALLSSKHAGLKFLCTVTPRVGNGMMIQTD
jgi:hypothetical protein